MSGRWGRDVTLLWVGQAVSQLGSRTYGVASLLWVLAQTGSVVTVGITSTVTLAAFASAQLPGGWLIDRCDRRHVMLGADLASAAAAAALTAFAATGTFPLVAVLAAMAVLGAAWAVRPAAEMAVLPGLLGDAVDELGSVDAAVEDAMGLLEARSAAAGLAGPAVAGIAFGVAAWLPFLIDTVSYLVAAATALAARVPARLGRSDPPAGMLAEIGDGLRLFWRDRFVRWTAVLAALGAFAVGGTGLTVLVLLDGDRIAPGATALVLGAGSAAGLAGALATPLLRRVLPAPLLLTLGPATAAVAVVALPLASGPVVLAAVYAAVFLLQPAWDALVTARWLTRVEDRYRGRVQSAAGLLGAVPMAATPTVAGALLVSVGPGPTCVVLAAVLGVVAVGALLLAWGALDEPAASEAVTVALALPSATPPSAAWPRVARPRVVDRRTVPQDQWRADPVTVALPGAWRHGVDAPTVRLLVATRR